MKWAITVLFLLGLTIGLWTYSKGGPAVPEMPVIDLTNADVDVAEAITRAKAEVLKSPRSSLAWRLLAMTLHAHNYGNEAVACYAATAALDGNNPVWPYLQGEILRGGTEPETALPYLERAAALGPPSSRARCRLGELLLLLNQADKAAAEFRTVLAAEPGNDCARLGLGQVAFTQQKYEEALRYLNPLDKNPAARKRACTLRAGACKHLGDADAADRERKLLAKLPEDTPWPDQALEAVNSLQVGLPVLIRRADYLLANDKNPVPVRDLLLQGANRYPKSDRVWSYLGRALANANDFQGAEQAFRKAIELAPNNAEPWINLGVLQQHQRLFQEAAAAFRKAIELRPTDGTAYFGLGVCLQGLEDFTGATDAFRQSIRLRPDLSEAHERLRALSGKS